MPPKRLFVLPGGAGTAKLAALLPVTPLKNPPRSPPRSVAAFTPLIIPVVASTVVLTPSETPVLKRSRSGLA